MKTCDHCGTPAAHRYAVRIGSRVAMVGSSCARSFKRARSSDLIRSLDRVGASTTIEEHQGAHAAPDQRDAPLWDLTGGKIYPDDVYLFGQRYYGIGDGSDSRAWNIALAYHNRPLRRITIYRAVPKGLKGVKILPGDWVTIDRRYATQHGRSHLRNEYRVISKLVQAGDLFTDGNSIMEWGYWPMSQETHAQFEAERRVRRALRAAQKK